MEKSILERLADKTAKSGSTRAKRNLAIFLALRDEINLAINNGWPVKDIWQLFYDEKKIVISYQVFLRLVKKHTDYTIYKRKRSGTGSGTATLEGDELALASDSDSEAQKKVTPKISKDAGKAEGFDWNNESNLDDLV